jgi:glycerophosphoryl diester phosphodiesterase
MLVTLENGKIVPSPYAREAKAAGLEIITWTLERSGTLTDGGGFYYQSVKEVTDNSGDTYQLLDVLAKDVGVIGVFSDWPATVTFYANCMGL